MRALGCKMRMAGGQTGRVAGAAEMQESPEATRAMERSWKNYEDAAARTITQQVRVCCAWAWVVGVLRCTVQTSVDGTFLLPMLDFMHL